LIKRSRIVVLSSLIVISVLLWFANFKYPNIYLQKLTYTGLALTIIYFFFELLFEGLVTKRIKEPKTRYSSRKIASILNLAIFLLALVSIWVEEPQNILIAFGLVGAGIAIALQDIFKNFIGGITILINGIYSVGDRIEISQKYGDVIDIGILYTTLMEMREWVAGDQATGRLAIVPNGAVLSSVTQNYTRDFDFLWDEITIPITYDSDWNEAATKILSIVKNETKEVSEHAEKSMLQIEEKYYLTKRSLEPAIFLTLTDNWITFDIRYMAEVRQRRLLHDKLSRMILNEIEKSEKIKIASTTLDITGFPPIKLKQEKSE
jgi:small-conductance mechanosensitive channel